MATPTIPVLIGSIKARVEELERLSYLNLERGANVGRNHMMNNQARFLEAETVQLRAMLGAHPISQENVNG